ncbi:hypothetical protein BDQ12DRAFT_708832 [Crucibulum laeve]|uniref:Uncharacterized protein n=1 Tax=Crucibulum laeve TaxID=68775 RepID=A0A5C3MIP2_9AGAR|nr:hypothetical protein BDQ12DRAFT_708832 [Crucibulum laeve]
MSTTMTSYYPSTPLLHLSIAFTNAAFAFSIINFRWGVEIHAMVIIAFSLTILFHIPLLLAAHRQDGRFWIIKVVSQEQYAAPLATVTTKSLSLTSYFGIAISSLITVTWFSAFICAIVFVAHNGRLEGIAAILLTAVECLLCVYITVRFVMERRKEQPIRLDSDTESVIGMPIGSVKNIITGRNEERTPLLDEAEH